MSRSYAELHSHTNFSFLHGASTVEDMTERGPTHDDRAGAVGDDVGEVGLAARDHLPGEGPGEGIVEQLPPALAAIDACIAFRTAQQASFDRALPRDEIAR